MADAKAPPVLADEAARNKRLNDEGFSVYPAQAQASAKRLPRSVRHTRWAYPRVGSRSRRLASANRTRNGVMRAFPSHGPAFESEVGMKSMHIGITRSSASPGDLSKWETVRRLRYGALLKLFRQRYGHAFPEDDAGRDDLFNLISVVSLAPTATDQKMAQVIELWAPWMQPDEAQLLIDHVQRLTIYERMPSPKELGERLRLTNAEREALRLWPIAPVDMTIEELKDQRKAKERERHRQRRRRRGVRTRVEY